MKNFVDPTTKYSKLVGFALAATGLFLGTVNIVNALGLKDSQIENSKNLIAQSRRDSFDRESRRSSKPRIAVLDFDYSSVNTPYVYDFSRSRGVSDILVNRLVRTGKYRVIERSQIDAILREQNLGASGRVNASTAAQIGKLLGVERMIIGSVTQFNVEKKRSGVSAFGFGGSSQRAEATVQLNVRVIDTDTGEIVAVAEAAETSNSSDDSVSVMGFGGNNSNTNEGKLLGQATIKAVDEIVNELGSQI
ncbi:MAG: CsgG/HfaB family protein [Prochloraceae cyanobacterium]|nr:CsgG/HfaB family protein [Prochloraceae cyanobacterium]